MCSGFFDLLCWLIRLSSAANTTNYLKNTPHHSSWLVWVLRNALYHRGSVTNGEVVHVKDESEGGGDKPKSREKGAIRDDAVDSLGYVWPWSQSHFRLFLSSRRSGGSGEERKEEKRNGWSNEREHTRNKKGHRQELTQSTGDIRSLYSYKPLEAALKQDERAVENGENRKCSCKFCRSCACSLCLLLMIATTLTYALPPSYLSCEDVHSYQLGARSVVQSQTRGPEASRHRCWCWHWPVGLLW